MNSNRANGVSRESDLDSDHHAVTSTAAFAESTSSSITGNTLQPQDNADVPAVTCDFSDANMPHDTEVTHRGTVSPLRQLAPDIIHISHGFISLSTLVHRASQQCWNDLTELITELMGPQLWLQEPSSGSTDTGKLRVGKNGISQPDHVLRKRIRLLEFAQTQRADLIKLLVLSNWGRQAAEVSRLIDLQSFIRVRYDSYNDVLLHAASMKRDLIRAQTANPDLATSVEALVSGNIGKISMVRMLNRYLTNVTDSMTVPVRLHLPTSSIPERNSRYIPKNKQDNPNETPTIRHHSSSISQLYSAQWSCEIRSSSRV